LLPLRLALADRPKLPRGGGSRREVRDGLEGKATLAAARARARRVALARRGTAYAAWRAALEKQGPVTIPVALTAVYAASEGRAYGPGWERSDHAWHSAVVSDLARDVFGNPYRPRPHIISLSTDQANVAKSIYENRDFGLVPILADALEEAGCTDGDILTHLRSPGPHVRGCWAIDLCLGLS
jgi:hypothetical protein